MSGPKRNYMFTIHVQVFEEWTPALHEKFRYLVAQRELAPTTHQPHWQGYVELKQPARIRQVKAWLGSETAHLEARLGTQQQAIEYCKKEETRLDDSEPVELGAAATQGERTDIAGALAVLREGGGLAAVLEQAPDVFVRYHRGLTAANDLLTEQTSQAIRDRLCVTVLVGPPGCGKTRAVYEENGLSDVYTLTQTSGTVWWNGYTGQQHLLLDDYYGWIPWGELLKVLDIYPLRVQTKGGFTHVRYLHVWITSNKPWDHWYHKSRAFAEQGALQRRIHSVRTYSADGTYTAASPAETPIEHAPLAMGFTQPPAPAYLAALPPPTPSWGLRRDYEGPLRSPVPALEYVPRGGFATGGAGAGGAIPNPQRGEKRQAERGADEDDSM